MTDKMDSCVKQIMGDGKDKEAAIAICMKQMESKMSEKMDDFEFTKFIPFSKVDEEKREVTGYATTPDKDSDGEIVEKSAVEAAMPEYMSLPGGGNLRVMHQPIAAGKVKGYKTDNNGTLIRAKVVDNDAWEKVKEKVYTGFSLGGRKLAMIKNRITKLRLSEISLVDRPANPNATFTLVKFQKNSIKDQLLEGLKKMDFENPIADKIRKGVIELEQIDKAKKEEAKEVEKKEEEKVEVKVEEKTVIVDEVNQKLDSLTSSVDSLVKVLTPKEEKIEKKEEAKDEPLSKLESKLDDIVERLEKIENTARPTKVKTHVVEKSGQEEDDTDSELAKVQKELDRLAEIREDNLEKFENGLDTDGRPFAKKAMALLKRKDALLLEQSFDEERS